MSATDSNKIVLVKGFKNAAEVAGGFPRIQNLPNLNLRQWYRFNGSNHASDYGFALNVGSEILEDNAKGAELRHLQHNEKFHLCPGMLKAFRSSTRNNAASPKALSANLTSLNNAQEMLECKSPEEALNLIVDSAEDDGLIYLGHNYSEDLYSSGYPLALVCNMNDNRFHWITWRTDDSRNYPTGQKPIVCASKSIGEPVVVGRSNDAFISMGDVLGSMHLKGSTHFAGFFHCPSNIAEGIDFTR